MKKLPKKRWTVVKNFPILFFLGCWVGLFVNSHANAVTIIHSNDVMGDIEPCGCRNNPQGGMARKANLVKRLQDSFLIQLDAGDLLFSTDQIPELLKDQSELQAEYLLNSMDLLHHDAAVPGEKDFALGFKTFEALRKKAKFKFLAANLFRSTEIKKKEPKAYLEPYIILFGKGEDEKQIRVAILGLVGKNLSWPKELAALPAIQIAKKYVPLLKKKADYVIALTHQGSEEDQLLAQKVPGIDFIFGGHTQSFFQKPMQVGTTYIFQSSFRNQYIGVAPISKPYESKSYKLIGLDAGYDSPAEALTQVDLHVKDFKKAIAELNSKQEAMLEEGVEANAFSKDSVHFQTFPSCAECHMKQFDFWRKTNHVNALSVLIEKDQAQNKECLTCHTVGLGNPNGFKNISQIGQMRVKADPADEEGKIQNMPIEDLSFFLKSMREAKTLKSEIKITPKSTESVPMKHALGMVVKSWAPVQCENCHGPAKGHPFTGKYSKKVEKTLCLSCHTAERAPEWYTKDGKPNMELLDSKRAMVTCPAGTLSEDEEP